MPIHLRPVPAADPDILYFPITEFREESALEGQLSNLLALMAARHGEHAAGARFAEAFCDVIARWAYDGNRVTAARFAMETELERAFRQELRRRAQDGTGLR